MRLFILLLAVVLTSWLVAQATVQSPPQPAGIANAQATPIVIHLPTPTPIPTARSTPVPPATATPPQVIVIQEPPPPAPREQAPARPLDQSQPQPAPAQVQQVPAQPVSQPPVQRVVPSTASAPPPPPGKPASSRIADHWLVEHQYPHPVTGLPAPARPGEAYFANGNLIQNDSRCYVKVFWSGQPVQGLGNGSWQLWKAVGTRDEIEAYVQDSLPAIEAHAKKPCTRLN